MKTTSVRPPVHTRGSRRLARAAPMRIEGEGRRSACLGIARARARRGPRSIASRQSRPPALPHRRRGRACLPAGPAGTTSPRSTRRASAPPPTRARAPVAGVRRPFLSSIPTPFLFFSLSTPLIRWPAVRPLLPAAAAGAGGRRGDGPVWLAPPGGGGAFVCMQGGSSTHLLCMQGGSSTHLHRGGRLPAPNCARSLRQDSGGGRVGAPPAPSFPAPGFLGRALTAPYSRPLRDIESPKDRRDPRRATPVTGIAAPAGTELGRRGPGQSVASPCRAAPGGGRARGARRQAAAQDWPPFPSHRGKGAGRRRTTSRADTEAAVGKRWAAGVHTACSRDQSVKYVSCYSAPQRPLLQERRALMLPTHPAGDGLV